MPNYLILIFIPLLILFFIITMNSLHKRGWNNSQERYKYDSGIFYGEKIRIRNISIDGLSSQNVINIKVSDQGLYLRPSVPFSLFSKPVLVPWNEITDLQDKKVLFTSYKRLVVGKPFATTIDIPEKDFYKISKYIKINKAE